MHQLSHDADTDLLVLIAEQQREVKRLTAKCEESTAQAREDKRALKTAEQRLKSLVEETIADRPLFQPREQPPALVAASRPPEPEAQETPQPEPERCPDCGGLLKLPTPKRKPNAKKACHLRFSGDKARAMRIPPEEVRAKRENPPELQPIADQAEPPYMMPGCPKGGTFSPDALGITETFDELYAISSAGSLLSGEIRGAVEVTIHPSGIKQLYIVTSAMFASGGYRQITLTPICYATVWYGPAHTPETLDRTHGYYGLQVQHNGRSYVVGHRDQAITVAFGAADTPDDVDDAGVVCEETAPDGDPDTWYSEPVTKLQLPGTIIQSLIDARLDTLGDIAGLLADDGFRALTDEPDLDYLEAAKARAAMDLWWLEHFEGVPTWAVNDPDDSPSDQRRNKDLIDWIQRERAGDIEPQWDRWSEFEVRLESGDPVRVVYDPRAFTDAGHFSLYGPMTETGYRSHHMPYGKGEPTTPIVQFTEQLAREVAAETAKAKVKGNRRQKKDAKAKAAPKTKAPRTEKFKAGAIQIVSVEAGDAEEIPLVEEKPAAATSSAAEPEPSSAAEPEPSSAAPDLKHYMVYHGDGDLYRVCLIKIGGDLLTAATFAKKRIGWQVANFDHPIRIDGPGTETLLLAEGGRWLETPRPIERDGESVKNNHTDQVPEECPPGKPRVYKVVYHDGHPAGDRTLRYYSATSPKAAVEWAKRDYPNYQAWRMEAKPSDEEHAAKAAKKKAETQRAVRRLYQEDDLEAMRRVEALPPDPEELTDTEELARG